MSELCKIESPISLHLMSLNFQGEENGERRLREIESESCKHKQWKKGTGDTREREKVSERESKREREREVGDR